MNPKIWGSHAWVFLHSVALNYPKEPTEHDKTRYKAFFTDLRYILPCGMCQAHYAENLKKIPIENALESRSTLSRWLVKVHNSVNESTGKPTLSYTQFIRKYEAMYNMETDYKYVALGIGTVALAIWYYYK